MAGAKLLTLLFLPIIANCQEYNQLPNWQNQDQNWPNNQQQNWPNNQQQNWPNQQDQNNPWSSPQGDVYDSQNHLTDDEKKCPKHWIRFHNSCYRFIKSPLKTRDEARRACEAYQSDLVSVSTVEEHGFLLQQLQWQDPQHRTWYIGARQSGGTSWTSDGDGTSLQFLENAFLPEPNDGIYVNRDALAYSFSNSLKRWGIARVPSHEQLLYICEASIDSLQNLAEDERDYTYGVEIDNPKQIPRGPYFIKQPENTVFDIVNRNLHNEIVLSCLAGGYPTPTYEWFKEDYDNVRLVATRIDPLSNPKYTISGGNLIIYNPDQTEDRGSYHCKASNEFGVIISETVELSFGYILEFNLKRSEERGDQNWGKAVYCDPPQHFPGIKYYWARDYFPNLVEEDKRVFVSNDGALYFSALEPIDQGNYSCNVQSVATATGKNGPFFPLKVNSHSSFQQLKFPNNFPKVFPEAPVAGQQVRMECIAFGYPVPSYNWTRRGAPLPRGAVLSSYNRVLTIPKVKVEDQGEYICRPYNDRASVENSVWLTIQAHPNYTIPLEDKHADLRSDVTWTCEAFGIPDVTYHWFKNGRLLDNLTLTGEERDRYIIQDNVLKILRVEQRDAGMFQCRARNQLKTTYSSGQLRVLALKPSFKKHPMESETYAADRGNVTIVCNPEAAPRPKFIWRKDGVIIGDGGRRTILRNGNLIIRPVSIEDEGMYSCKAENQYGYDETRGRLIVLRGPTLIESLPQRIITAVMYNQTLRCMASNDDTLDTAYIWKHNGIRIRDKDLLANPRWRIDGGILNLINITLSDAGDYECTIRSAVGEVSSRTTLIVEGPPGPPGGVQVINVMKTSVTLEWTDGAHNGRQITRYNIAARTRWNSTWVNISENVFAEGKSSYQNRKIARLENVLNPFTTYEFAIQAANDYGFGPLSMPSPQFSTPPDKPTKAPSRVGGGGGKLGDLTITWDPLPPQDQHGRGIYYKVFWRRKAGDSEFQTRILRDAGNVGIAVVQIDIKYYYTEYEVKVQAFNEAGEGPISEPVTIFSAEDMPQVQPQSVSALSYNSTSLNVTWQPIDESRETVRGKLIGYRLKYWPLEGKEELCVYYLSRTTRPWALIVGLQPDTMYHVKVMAYNSAGAGPESERFRERTYRMAPHNPPSSVFVYDVNPSTVRVVWRYVQSNLEEEPLDGFKIRIWEVDQDMTTANDTIIPAGVKLEGYIYNLSPGKTYNLRVLAFSKGGDGRMSSPPNVFQMGDPAFFRSSAGYKVLDGSLAFFVIFVFWRLGGLI